MATEALNIIYNNNLGDGLLMEKDASLNSATAATENQDIVDKNPFLRSGSITFVPRTTWLRWPILFLFVNCIMIVSALSLCLAPASSDLARGYDVSILMVNMCGIIFTATFIPMTFVSMQMYKTMGTHTVLRIASVLMLVGGWGRMYALEGQFWPILVGQVIISLSQPIYYNVMTQISNKWFPDSERSLVTAICGLSIPGGNLVAFLLSGLIFAGIEEMTSAEVK